MKIRRMEESRPAVHSAATMRLIEAASMQSVDRQLESMELGMMRPARMQHAAAAVHNMAEYHTLYLDGDDESPGLFDNMDSFFRGFKQKK